MTAVVRAGRSPAARLAAGAWLLAGAHAIAILLGAPGTRTYPGLIAQHLGVAVALTLALWRRFAGFRQRWRWVALGAALAAGFPLLGPFAAACLFLPLSRLARRLHRRAADTTLPDEAPAPRRARGHASPADVMAYLDVEPYAELVVAADAATKKSVINTMAARPSPSFVRLLRACVSDPRRDVSQLAIAALSRIERAHGDAVVAATQAVRRAPQSGAAHVALGEAYEKFAGSGLVNGVLGPRYRALARASYRVALYRDARQASAREAIARLAAEDARLDDALGMYRVLLDDPHTRTAARLGVLRTWYELGRRAGDDRAWRELSTAVGSWRRAPAPLNGGADAATIEHLAWWLGRDG